MTNWACDFKPGKDDKMNDWMNDYVIEYEENGERYQAIWSGFTREEAIETFMAVHPERRVIEKEKP